MYKNAFVYNTHLLATKFLKIHLPYTIRIDFLDSVVAKFLLNLNFLLLFIKFVNNKNINNDFKRKLCVVSRGEKHK